mmetsp:Transcript_111975/g.222569  ORF Transcript_111975/g.222569 Transcript_111975/m.222569 type:complete len:132 (-) Transcript_111975:56-451(-)
MGACISLANACTAVMRLFGWQVAAWCQRGCAIQTNLRQSSNEALLLGRARTIPFFLSVAIAWQACGDDKQSTIFIGVLPRATGRPVNMSPGRKFMKVPHCWKWGGKRLDLRHISQQANCSHAAGLASSTCV